MRNFWLQVEHETACFEQEDGSTNKYLAGDKFVLDYLSLGGILEEKFTSEILKESDKNQKILDIHKKMGDLMGVMTPAESMFLMLQYGNAKMNPTPVNDQDDESISLTPTGEDIITWGDNLASNLEILITELRGLK